MPLYIDLHIDSSLTPELIEKCHIADKAIQDKFGVRYLQVLLNQPQGHLFCLVEGPDKESCAKVHQLAHGSIACNILEITQSDFSALLANRAKDHRDFTLNKDGSIDTGTRAVLAFNVLGSPAILPGVRQVIKKILQENNGNTVENMSGQLFGFFDTSTTAINTSVVISKEIVEKNIPVEIRMGVSIGSLIGKTGELFEEARRIASRLAFVAGCNQACIPSVMLNLYKEDIQSIKANVKVVSPPDEKFILDVLNCVELERTNHQLTVTEFTKEIGLSKSQLTRKLNALTGLSPLDFMKEFRLRKSIALMEEQKMNVAEISTATGFSNAAYFAKCFRERFGSVPSQFGVRN